MSVLRAMFSLRNVFHAALSTAIYAAILWSIGDWPGVGSILLFGSWMFMLIPILDHLFGRNAPIWGTRDRKAD